MVDCGDEAADWLRSVVNVENVRLVRHQFTDGQTQSSRLRSPESTDDAGQISATRPDAEPGLLHSNNSVFYFSTSLLSVICLLLLMSTVDSAYMHGLGATG